MTQKTFAISIVILIIFVSTLYALTDTDSDGMPDTWETLYSLNISVNDAGEDPDCDSVTNLNEYYSGTDPRDNDSDNDGLTDTDEVIPGVKDDFENGLFHLNWQFSGYDDWIVCDNEAQQGAFSACTPALPDNQYVKMNYTVTLTAASELSFQYKVSTEANFDKFFIRVDNVLKGTYSGEVPWTRYSQSLAVGQHTVEFKYQKDLVWGANQDTVWIDDFIISSGSNKYGTDATNPDSDNDGLLDGDEVFIYATDPTDTDSDNDTLLDGDEVTTYATNPADNDTDGDGIYDNQELFTYFTDPLNIDSDNDGLADGWELSVGTSPLDNDTDDDNQYDGWEVLYDLDPLVNDADNDADNDGLINIAEFYLKTNPSSDDTDEDDLTDSQEVNTYFTNPLSEDSDNDGMTDGWEVKYTLNPIVDDADNDTDNDTITNYEEFLVSTSPLLNDTDNDGLSDNEEILYVVTHEKIVNYFTGTIQISPALATDGTNCLVAWQIYNPIDNDGYNVVGKFIDDNTKAISNEFLINTYTSLSQWQPDVEWTGSSYCVAWQSEEADGSEFGLQGILITPDGAALTPEISINAYTTGEQSYPAISSNGTKFVVLWNSLQDGSEFGIYARTLDQSGVLGTEYRVNAFTTSYQAVPSVLRIGSHYLATWMSYGQDDFAYGIFGRYLTDSGSPSGSEFQISSAGGYNQQFPVMATDGTNVLVVWESLYQDGEGRGIFAQLLDSSGNKIGSEFQVNTLNQGTQSNASVACNGSFYLVVWSSVNADDSTNTNIHAQMINLAGEKIGYEFLINSDYDGVNTSAAVKNVGDAFIVVWEAIPSDGSYYDIHIAKVTTPGGFDTNPNNQDSDYDGIKDGDEVYIYHTDPTNQDSDNDFMPDAWEIKYNYNPLEQDADTDEDNDTLSALAEYNLGTNPTLQDSDNDGLSDIDETAYIVWNEQQVNSFSPYSQTAPVIATDGSDYLIVWQSPSQDGSDSGIFARRVAANGEPIGSDFRVNTYTTDAQSEPIVTASGSTYLIAWMSTDQDGDETGVYGQFVNNDGSFIGSEFRINAFTTGDQGYPTIAANASEFLAAWDQTDYYSEFDIYSNHIELDGTTPVLSNIVPGKQFYYSFIGANAVGESSGTFTQSVLYANPGHVALATADLKSLYFYGYMQGSMKLAIYEADITGQPTKFIGGTVSLSGGDLGWHQFPLDRRIILKQNKKYYISVINETSYNTYFYTAATGGFSGAQLYSEAFSSIAPDMSAWNNQFSAFGIYAAGERPDNSHLDDWIRLDSSNPDIACKFTTNDGGELVKVRLRLRQSGTVPSGNIWLKVHMSDNVVPKALLGTSIPVEATHITTDQYGENVDFHFEPPIPLTAETQYWLLLDGDYPFTSTYGIAWGADADYTENGIGENVVANHSGLWEPLHKTCVYATWFKRTDEYDQIVNTYTTASQYYPVIASNGTSFLMTWRSYGQDGSNTGLYAQAYNEYGLKTGTEFRINQYTTDDQKDVAIASDGSRYLLTWESTDQDGSDSGIYGRLIQSDGTPAGNEFIINEQTGSDQFDPAVAWNGSVYLAVWASTYQLDSEANIMGRFFDANGTALGSEFVINDFEGQHIAPGVSSNGGDFLVTWQSNSVITNSYDIVCARVSQRSGYGTDPSEADSDFDGLSDKEELQTYNTNPLYFDSDGDSMADGWEVEYNLDPLSMDESDDNDNDTIINYLEYLYYTNPTLADSDCDGLTDREEIKEFRINAYTTGSQYYPSIATDGSHYLVVWSSSLQDSGTEGIYARMISTDFSAATSEFQVNSYTTGLQQYPMCAASDTSYMVVWQSDGQDGSSSAIIGRAFGLDGSALSGEFQINTYTTSTQSIASIASNGTTFCVTWNSGQQDGDNSGIFGRIYSPAGTPLSDEIQVNAYTTSAQHSSYISSDGNRYLVVWTSYGQDGAYEGIFGRFLTATGTYDSDEFRVNASTALSETVPRVTFCNGRYLVVWQTWNFMGTQGFLVGQLLDNDGNFDGEAFPINAQLLTASTLQTVASDGTDFFVAWHALNENSNYDVYGQFIDYTGLLIGNQFRLHYLKILSQRFPYACSDGNGYFVAWSSSYQDLSGYALYGIHISKNETELRSDPLNADTDNDGLSDGDEQFYGTFAGNPDTDNDGQPDGWETAQGLSPLDNDAYYDADNDGLVNIQEFNYMTSANNPDSDNDEQNDYFEIVAGSDPLDMNSSFSFSITERLLRWTCFSGRSYQIYSTDDLHEPFTAHSVWFSPGYTGTQQFEDTGFDMDNDGLYITSGDKLPPSDGNFQKRMYRIKIRYNDF